MNIMSGQVNENAEKKGKTKVLLYSLDGYSTFFTDTNYIFGGIEKETAYHAQELATYDDLEVVVVTKDQAEKQRNLGKIEILQHPTLKGEGYWEWRRSLKGKLALKIRGEQKVNIQSFYREINPDVVFCMGLQPGDLDLLKYCKENQKQFIFKLAHDNELQDNTVDGKPSNGKIDKELSELVRNSKYVLCQTPLQYDLLKQNYNMEGVMHYNPIDLDLIFDINNKQYDLFWVGRSTKFKRPELFIELCRELPDLKACMVMNILDEDYWNELTKDLPENIELIPSVPADKIDNYFAMTKLFISTSDSEGFANTYLQSAKHSVPVLSMCCDPNEMLSKHNAGVLVGDDLSKLKETIEKLLADDQERGILSKNARKYVEEFHDLKKVSAQLRDLILA